MGTADGCVVGRRGLDGPTDHLDFVMRQLENLRTITGHRIEIAEGDDADAWLIFGAPTPEAALASHAELFAPLYSNEAALAADLNEEPVEKDKLCRSKWGTSTEHPHEIVYAVGQVPSELSEDRIQRCILRLLVSALGGVASESSTIREPEEPSEETGPEGAEEAILLTVWYDSRVEPGMTVEEIKPIMWEKLQQLLKVDQQLRAK
jgi:hypothetical protein